MSPTPPTAPPPGNNNKNKRPKHEEPQQQQSTAGLGERDAAPVHVTTTIATADAATGDLMQRLQSFLPQLQAANQALLAADTTTLDDTLEQEVASSSDDDDDDDDDDESADNDDDDDSEANTAGDGVQTVPKKRRPNRKKNYAGIQEALSDGGGGGYGLTAAAATIATANSEDHNNDDDDHDNAGTTGPTIQLQFALGDMTHNPMMELLQASEEAAEGNDEDDSMGGESHGDDDVDLGANSSDRIGAVAKLLQRSQKETTESPAVGITHTVAAVMKGTGGNSSKRPLITEL